MVKDNINQNIEIEKPIETQEIIQPQPTENIPVKKKKPWLMISLIILIIISIGTVGIFAYQNYLLKNSSSAKKGSLVAMPSPAPSKDFLRGEANQIFCEKDNKIYQIDENNNKPQLIIDFSELTKKDFDRGASQGIIGLSPDKKTLFYNIGEFYIKTYEHAPAGTVYNYDANNTTTLYAYNIDKKTINKLKDFSGVGSWSYFRLIPSPTGTNFILIRYLYWGNSSSSSSEIISFLGASLNPKNFYVRNFFNGARSSSPLTYKSNDSSDFIFIDENKLAILEPTEKINQTGEPLSKTIAEEQVKIDKLSTINLLTGEKRNLLTAKENEGIDINVFRDDFIYYSIYDKNHSWTSSDNPSLDFNSQSSFFSFWKIRTDGEENEKITIDQLKEIISYQEKNSPLFDFEKNCNF